MSEWIKSVEKCKYTIEKTKDGNAGLEKLITQRQKLYWRP